MFNEGVIPPAITLGPAGVSFASHLAGLPRGDIIYIVETSGNLLDWTPIGWWTTNSSDQSKVEFSVEPTTDGGADMSAIWSSEDATGSFARLRFELR